MVNEKIIKKLDEFVTKINDKTWEIDQSKTVLLDNEDPLNEMLGKTMSDYELTSPSSYVYDKDVEFFNEFVNIAYLNGIVIDNKLKKENEEFKIEKEQIQTKINNLNTQNGKLVEENMKFRKGIRKIFDENSEIENKYGWLLENTKKEVSKID